MAHVDVLIFVEDPGAANYIAELPDALARTGRRTKLLADGKAAGYLGQRQIPLEAVSHPVTAAHILDSTSTRLVLVGTAENPDTLGLALVAEAHRRKIASIGVIDAPTNPEYQFRGRSEDPLAFAPDWLLLPDEPAKAAYVDLGYPEGRSIVCGHPHYDYIQATAGRLAGMDRKALRKRLLPGVSDNRPVILFAAEISTGHNPQQFRRSADYTLEGSGKSNRRTDIVLEEFLDAVRFLQPRPYLVLRLHPKNRLDEFTQYVDAFDRVSSGGSPLELVYISDLVIGMTSMLVMEAAIMGKPTLSIVPRAYEKDWLPSIRMGLTPSVTTREQLQATLGALLQDSQSFSPVGEDGEIVFGALQRVLDFVESRLDS